MPPRKKIPPKFIGKAKPLGEGMMESIITDSAIEIARAVNKIQMDVDAFVAVQGRVMTRESLRAILFGGNSSVIQNTVNSFSSHIEKVLVGALWESMNKGMTTFQAENNEPETIYTWRTTSTNTCPDCEARNNMTGTLEEFEQIGLPGAGSTVCGHYCKCILDAKDTGKIETSRGENG